MSPPGWCMDNSEMCLSAANEVAVAALLAGQIRYGDIPRVVESTLSAEPAGQVDSLEAALAFDENARDRARGLVASLPGGAL